jgi:hypothetical protein
MPAQISENVESREFTTGSGASRELVYDVIGTLDENEVQDLLLATSPGDYMGLLRESVSANHQGRGVWKGTARYRGAAWDAAVGGGGAAETLREFSFDTSGGTQKTTQGIDTTAWDAVGKTGPDFGGAIGVNNDTVEGVDIFIPKYEFQEVHAFAPERITQAYKLTLFNMTGMVNDAPWRGFAKGEVLFLGAQGRSGSRDEEGAWSISYKFACSPNRDWIDIGTEILGVTKEGWQYLWVFYESVEDSGAHAMVKRPLTAFVEQVYRYDDFLKLEIG